MLKHPENAHLKVCEETTGTVFDLTPRSADNLPDLTDDHFTAIVEALTFIEKLNNNKDSESVTKFITDNFGEAGKHMFASLLHVFEEVDSKSDLSSMIIEYGCILRTQIYQLITYNSSMVNYHKVQPNKKCVLFNEEELRATTVGIHPFYNTHQCDMTRHYTQFASESIADSARAVMLSVSSYFAPGYH
jgi:hypothetical protein